MGSYDSIVEALNDLKDRGYNANLSYEMAKKLQTHPSFAEAQVK